MSEVEKLAKKVEGLSPEGQEAVKGILDIMNSTTDIFLWANQVDAVKRSMEVEMFLFNKNYTPYKVRISDILSSVHINPLFLYDLINFVNMGAGTGLAVRNINDAHAINELAHVKLGEVGRADTLIHLIEHEYHDLVEFSELEHEIKRQRGIIVRFTHKESGLKFYVVKAIPQSKVISGGDSWQFANGQFDMMESAALKVPKENHVLIVNDDIFAFNRKKFETLFGYKARELKEADEKGKILDKHFKFNFTSTTVPEIAFIARESSTLIKKLLQVDVDNLITQEQVLEVVEDMDIELMVDDSGAIIFMEGADVGTFLDIVNDNYLRSPIGNEYLAKSKKPINEKEN